MCLGIFGGILDKREVLKEYCKFITKYKRYPSRAELKDVSDISRDQVRSTYGNYEALKKAAIATGKLNDIILDVEQFDQEYIDKTVKKLSRYKRFVITTAVSNAKVCVKYFENLKNYCRHENAALIVIPSLLKGTGSKWALDPILKDEFIVFYDLALNSNIKILGLINNAKSVDPITGLPRLGKRNGSIICASPKQNLKIVPTGINKLPHALMSTGAVTTSGYTTVGPMRAKTDYLADSDHVLGALIVEIDSEGIYHYRQTQSDISYGVTDLGSYYFNGRKMPYSPEALIPGDWHSGETDSIVIDSLFNLTKKLKINEWVLHDVFSGNSTNHHLLNKNIELAKMSNENKLSLNSELNHFENDLKMISDKVKKLTIVRSNHDDFLDRYLTEGRYISDPQNHEIALELALSKVRGNNPLEYFINTRTKLKLNWLKLDESYKIAGVEMAMHGHLGSNGARGTAKSMEEAYGSVMYGHTHTPNILRSAWCVGTSTHLQLPYNRGASSWLQTAGTIYNNGVKQLINFIEGKYTTRKI